MPRTADVVSTPALTSNRATLGKISWMERCLLALTIAANATRQATEQGREAGIVAAFNQQASRRPRRLPLLPSKVFTVSSPQQRLTSVSITPAAARPAMVSTCMPRLRGSAEEVVYTAAFTATAFVSLRPAGSVRVEPRITPFICAHAVFSSGGLFACPGDFCCSTHGSALA